MKNMYTIHDTYVVISIYSKGEYLQLLLDLIDIDKVTAIPGTWSLSGGRVKYISTVSKGVSVILHRYILNAEKGQIIDHINGNTLDNRRANLRFVTASENQHNRYNMKNNTSGILGVSLCKRTSKWIGQVCINGTNHWLGRFDTPENAKEAVERKRSEVI